MSDAWQSPINRLGDRNLFRVNGRIDRQYLRICAVHALLERNVIGTERAIELLAQRKVQNPRRLVELWREYPRKRFHGETARPMGAFGFRLVPLAQIAERSAA